MADRGRKAHPCGSHVIDEWWQTHVKQLHHERLNRLGPTIDMTAPVSMSHAPNPAKKKQKERDQQTEVDLENQILLEKLIKIKNFDSTKVFKPWLARSTFQYKAGSYFDPVTGTRCVDHLNPTATISPRSTLSPGAQPGAGGPGAYGPNQKYLRILEGNTKLLRTIEATDSVYNVGRMNQAAMVNAAHSRRLSNYHGPEDSRYQAGGQTLSQGAARRPNTAHCADLRPRQNQYLPLNRPSTSAPAYRNGAATAANRALDYGWGPPSTQDATDISHPHDQGLDHTLSQATGRLTAARSAGVSSATHSQELTELGVVDENDMEGQDSQVTMDQTAPETAAATTTPVRQPSGSSGSGSVRPAGSVHSTQSDFARSAAPRSPLASGSGKGKLSASNSVSSVHSAVASARSSVNAALSPYQQQPVGSRRTSAASGGGLERRTSAASTMGLDPSRNPSQTSKTSRPSTPLGGSRPSSARFSSSRLAPVATEALALSPSAPASERSAARSGAAEELAEEPLHAEASAASSAVAAAAPEASVTSVPSDEPAFEDEPEAKPEPSENEPKVDQAEPEAPQSEPESEPEAEASSQGVAVADTAPPEDAQEDEETNPADKEEASSETGGFVDESAPSTHSQAVALDSPEAEASAAATDASGAELQDAANAAGLEEEDSGGDLHEAANAGGLEAEESEPDVEEAQPEAEASGAKSEPDGSAGSLQEAEASSQDVPAADEAHEEEPQGDEEAGPADEEEGDEGEEEGDRDASGAQELDSMDDIILPPAISDSL